MPRFYTRYQFRSSAPRRRHGVKRFAKVWQRWGKWRPTLRRYRRYGLMALLTCALTVLQIGGLWPLAPAMAATNLSIEPLTWDMVGLDSNNVNQGPNQYLTGARVCNIGAEPAQNLRVRFVREGATNPYMTIVNSLNSDIWQTDSLPSGPKPPNHHVVAAKPANCFDAYYVVTVSRNAAAYNTAQRFRIEAVADNAGVVDTNSYPDTGQYDTGHPRQLYVESILSQARNDVLSFENLTTPGSMTVEVGGTYTFRLTSQTATGYPQLTISSDFPNIVFQILNVSTTYSSDPGFVNSSIYANACGWISDPSYPGYRTSANNCNYPLISDKDTSGDGKVGNTVVTEYTIKVLSTGPGNTSSQNHTVNHLILDFSGGSYHYNADYGSQVGLGSTTITVVDRQADLSLTKSHSGNFATGNNTYTLTVTNNGPDLARGPITVTDTLPTGFTYVSASGSGWSCGANGQIVTCTNPNDLPVGSSAFNLTVAVDSSAASNSVNTATVTSATRDPNLSNNSAADPTTIVQGPNIQLAKTHSPATFVTGTTGTYTLTVSNSSGFDAVGPLTIIDTLPAGLTYSSASGSGWSCTANGQTVICTNPSGLNNGQTSGLTLTVNVNPDVATPSVTNTATVSSGSFDTNPADNTASDITDTSKPVPDLIVSKTDNNLNFAQSAQGTYTITVTNQGVASTTGPITVVDTLPTSFTYVSATAAAGSSGWSCSFAAPNVTCTNPGPLTPNQSSSILLTVTPTTTGTFTNTVTVSTPGETQTTNNSGSDNTTVAAGTLDLEIIKTLTTAPTGPNSPIAYTVRVNNKSSGNGNDTGVTMRDVVPSTITNVAWTCSVPEPNAGVGNGSNSCNGTNTNPLSGTGNTIEVNTISLRKANVQGGGYVQFAITGTVGSGFTGNVANTATVTPSSGTDIIPTNNVSTATTTVPGPDLSLAKTAFGSFAQNVDSVYRLTVTNTSTTLATSQPITVKDVLPAALTYVSAASASGSSGWSCSFEATSRTVTCINTNSLSAGATSAIDLTVRPTASGSVTNAASVSSPGDTNADNNNASATTTVAAANPDLSITKADTGNFALGQEGTYILTVSNVGTTVAVAPLVVTDTLPTGLSYLSGSGNGWICSAAGQTVTCTNYSNLAPGASTVLNLKVLVGSTTPASISNTATVATVSGETVTANNTSNTLITAIAQQADLSIAKTLVGNLVTGQTATYQLKVTNNGPSPSVAPITVTDALPAGLSFVSGAGDGFSCSAGTSITCTRNTTMGVGASATISLEVSVSAAGGATVVNSATVSGTTPDPTGGNNSSSTSNSVQNVVQSLSLNKSHFGSFPVGGQGTYTLAITNTGNATITDTLRITDTLPGNLSFAFAVGQGWTCTGTTTVTCTSDDDLAPGTSNAVDLTVNVGAGTPVGNNSVTNSASVFIGASATASASDTDPTTITTSADLSLTKTAATAFVAGQQAQYTLVVTNAVSSSGAAAAPITLEDQLPDGLTYVSGTGTGWSCPTAPAGPDIACTLGSALAPGDSSTLTLTVQVDSAIASPFTNVATTYSPTPDPNTTNNTATVTNSLGGGGTADITVTKTDNADPVTIGSPLTYTVTAINGDATTSATGVTVTDTLPGGVTFVSANPDQGTCSESGGTITCSLGTIPAGGSVAIAVQVTPQVSGILVNTATVASTNDSDTTNNSATQDTTVIAGSGENIISGRVFLDSDGNGTLNGSEGGTANITVWLYEDLNGNGTLEATDKLLSSQVSNPSGDFSFAVNRTGNFLLTLDIDDPDLPAGHSLTTSPLPTVAIATVDGSISSGNNLGHAGPIASAPEILLVKRITAVNGTPLTNLVDGINTPGPNYVAAPRDQDDNHPHWPSNFLRGQMTSDMQPGDTVEFTIYFLSSGTVPAQNALFCDLVPANVSFIPDAFNGTAAASGPNPVPGVTTAGGDRGIVLGLGTESSTNPYPISVALSNSSDGDVGQYVPPGTNLTSLDARLSGCGNNTNGAIVANLGTLPPATGAGDPPGAYGFVRFRGRID
ncbi:hypothetical protein [Nodosilinea sp. E11]|uniref:DUF7933 domain-containing protein n=1 Tax=Nodosilinea sp. E11 TaxID=3037479 RepID=UPI002934AD04|nr:hypothetical protein [Nodosilinea sp. E11]WOD39611.1 hypothetical protein RRF56_25730 [Nodosilinea sp. E11]